MTEKKKLNHDDMYFDLPFLFSHYTMYDLLFCFWDEWCKTMQNPTEAALIMVLALLVAKKYILNGDNMYGLLTIFWDKSGVSTENHKCCVDYISNLTGDWNFPIQG